MGGQAGYQSCQGGCVQRRFDLGELARIRQHHHQRKVWVGVGEGGRDEIRPLHGRKVGAKRLHELHGHGTTVEARERIIPGLALVENVPGSIEVDCVGQNQCGSAIDGVAWQQVLDLVVGPASDPRIDGQAGSIGRIDEVEQVHARAVVRSQGVEEVGPEGVRLLGPEGVDDVHLHGQAISAEPALTA